jgi:C4-dicarboxylate-specific signal transduction histidine kinase
VRRSTFAKDRSRVPVPVGATTFGDRQDEGAAFVLDLMELKHAEKALRDTQTNLAQVMRVTMLNELTASIAHEVNAPLADVVVNAEACLRWLDRGTPDLDAVRRSMDRRWQSGE